MVDDRDDSRSGPGLIGLIGFFLFLCGLGMGVFSSVAFFDEQVTEIPGSDALEPALGRSDPLLAGVLVALGVVLIAISAARGRDRS